ncbi:MAG: hypothetical protein ACI9VR_004795 [Cognaticolwellia sp.]|jgi:hypothetical protein
MRALTLAPLLILALTACTGQGEGEIDPDLPERACADGVDNDQDGLTDCADDDCDGDAVCDKDEGEPEICDDGLDNDLDGQADCDDSDCADVAPCWWPETIEHEGDFQFEGGYFDCGVWGGDDIDDCTERYVTSLKENTAASCADCDIAFVGELDWKSRECKEKYGDSVGNGAEQANIGFKFTSQTNWTLYSKDSQGNWKEAVTMEQQADGSFVTSDESEISGTVPPYESCGEQDLGTLTTTLTFTP